MLEEMGERWQAGQFSITVEHFATALIRSRLGAIFHAQATPASGPLVLVGCAPGEQHELGALVLALLLRRHYPALRVIYLGQNVEATHLLETIQTSHPAVVCLSAALLEHRPSLAAVARQIATLPPVHRPKLVYGGRAFDQKDEEVDGIFLGTNAAQALILIEHLCTYPTFFRS
jgi:methanogenic corrinoid protein MtbC1